MLGASFLGSFRSTSPVTQVSDHWSDDHMRMVFICSRSREGRNIRGSTCVRPAITHPCHLGNQPEEVDRSDL